MTVEESRLSRIAAYVRAHGWRLVAEVVFNFALPYVVYSLASGQIGAAPALLAASIPPMLWSLGIFIRERKVDAISVLVLAGIALSLIAFIGGGGVKFLQLRENLVGAVVSLIFLGSAAIGRPLIRELARAGSRRRGPQAAAIVEALRDDAEFRRATMVVTLVWGFGLAAGFVIHCALVFTISIKQYLLISGPTSTVTLGLLTAWTYWFLPRVVRQAMARHSPSA